MRAGRLRNRLVIERATNVQGTNGEITQSWATLATVWGEVKDLRGTELIEGQQAEATMSTKITMRYRTGIDAKDRVTWAGHVYEVVAVAADANALRELELMCREVDPPRTA